MAVKLILYITTIIIQRLTHHVSQEDELQAQW